LGGWVELDVLGPFGRCCLSAQKRGGGIVKNQVRSQQVCSKKLALRRLSTTGIIKQQLVYDVYYLYRKGSIRRKAETEGRNISLKKPKTTKTNNKKKQTTKRKMTSNPKPPPHNHKSPPPTPAQQSRKAKHPHNNKIQNKTKKNIKKHNRKTNPKNKKTKPAHQKGGKKRNQITDTRTAPRQNKKQQHTE